MSMATIQLPGTITEDGQLDVELPAGEARITIEIPAPGWTSEELAEALKIQPLTGAEMVAAGLTGGWEVNESGAEWVERQRRERREQRRQ
jgi:hypothetical protein